MPEHQKLVIMAGLMLVPGGLNAQEMGKADPTMMESDSSVHEMPMEMSAAEKFEAEGDEYRDAFNSEMALQSYLNASRSCRAVRTGRGQSARTAGHSRQYREGGAHCRASQEGLLARCHRERGSCERRREG